MVHGDNSGLILPPRVANVQVSGRRGGGGRGREGGEGGGEEGRRGYIGLIRSLKKHIAPTLSLPHVPSLSSTGGCDTLWHNGFSVS